MNKKAFEKFKKEHSAVPPTVDNAVPSERFEGERDLPSASLSPRQISCGVGNLGVGRFLT